MSERHFLTALTLLLGGLFFSVSVVAEIYRWVDGAGRVHYSDSVKEDQPAETVEVMTNRYEHVPYEALPKQNISAARASRKVVMYSTSWCGYCVKARKYFKSKGIAYADYDIEKNKRAKRRYDRLGGAGIPLILVGKKRMSGFNVAGFEAIYSRK